MSTFVSKIWSGNFRKCEFTVSKKVNVNLEILNFTEISVALSKIRRLMYACYFYELSGC